MKTQTLGLLVGLGILLTGSTANAQHKTAGWTAPGPGAFHPPAYHPPAYHPSQGWQSPSRNNWGGSVYIGGGGVVVAGGNGSYGGVVAIGSPGYGYYGGGVNWAAVDARNNAIAQQAIYATSYTPTAYYTPGINWAAVNARNDAIAQQAAYSSGGYVPAPVAAPGINWAAVDARNNAIANGGSVSFSDNNGHVGVGGTLHTKNFSIGGAYHQ